MRPSAALLLVALAVPSGMAATAATSATSATSATPATPAATRTVHRCVAGGTVSLASAPEPGSRCEAITFPADSPKLPDLWRTGAGRTGVLWQRQQDGRTVYSTRELPGSVRVLAFTVPAPPGSKAHVGLGNLGPPRWDVMRESFRDAARSTGVEEAWLRAIAHAESGFDASAESDAGAVGVMQLMPDTAADYEVTDRRDPNQSIHAGARHLRDLMRRYPGDLRKVAAAYNAGASVVDAYGGVPPYAETQAYVEKALELHRRYRAGAPR